MKKLPLCLVPILACVLSGFSGCWLFEPNCHTIYEFEIPLQLYPKQDTFAVGDTIWIEASFSDTLRDFISGKAYYMPDFNFSTAFSISHPTDTLIEGRYWIGAANKFEIHNVIGSSGAPWVANELGHIYFDESGDFNRLLSGVIAKDTGKYNFSIAFIDPPNVKDVVDPLETSCYEVVEDLRYHWGSPEENNFFMAKKYIDTLLLLPESQAISNAVKYNVQHASFTFVVK